MFKSSRSEIREAVVGPKINRQAKAKPFATETDPALGSDTDILFAKIRRSPKATAPLIENLGLTSYEHMSIAAPPINTKAMYMKSFLLIFNEPVEANYLILFIPITN